MELPPDHIDNEVNNELSFEEICGKLCTKATKLEEIRNYKVGCLPVLHDVKT